MSSYFQLFWSSPKKKKTRGGLATQSLSQLSVASGGSEEENDDKWICQECKKTFTEDDAQVVECQRCEKHFCAKCINLNKEEYRVISKRRDIFWFCPPCAIKAKAAWGKETAMEDCCKDLMDKVTEKLTELEQKMDDRMGQMETQLNTTTTYAETAAKGCTKVATQEFTDIVKKTVADESVKKKQDESREGNIIIHRASESTKESPEERVADDKEFFDSFCQEALEIGKIEVKSIIQLGKKNENSQARPMKITLEEPQDKTKIMARLRKLKNAEERFRVSVMHDLSPEDRKLVRDKVEQAKLKEKNENEGGQYVYRVRGPPWDLRIVKIPVTETST